MKRIIYMDAATETRCPDDFSNLKTNIAKIFETLKHTI